MLQTKKRKGFGLIEALIASGIIVGVASASVGLSTKILRNTVSFDGKIVADNLTAKQIEGIHWLRKNTIATNQTNPGSYLDTCVNLPKCSVRPNGSSADPKIVLSTSETTELLNGIQYYSYFTTEKLSASSDKGYEVTAIVEKVEDGSRINVSEIKTILTNWRMTQ